MQVSKIAVSNQFSANKNQKSPAFGDRIILANSKCPNLEGTIQALRVHLQEFGVPWEAMTVSKVGTDKTAVGCSDSFTKKLAAMFIEYSKDIKKSLGMRYNGRGLKDEMQARKAFHSSSVGSYFEAPIPEKQHLVIADLIPAWSKAA